MADLRLVKHVCCNKLTYNSLGTHDEDTIYFIEDAQEIYKGDILCGTAKSGSGNVEYSKEVPDYETMDEDTSYIVISDDGAVVIYQKGETGVEVAGSSLSKEDVTDIVKDFVDTYAGVDECFVDVEADASEKGKTELTFTRNNGDTKSITVADLFLSGASYDKDTHILTLIISGSEEPVEIDLSDLVDETLLGNKVDKVEDAVEDNLATFVEGGNIKDSGYKIEDIACTWTYIPSDNSVFVTSLKEIDDAFADDTIDTVVLNSDIAEVISEDSTGIELKGGVEKDLDLNGHTFSINGEAGIEVWAVDVWENSTLNIYDTAGNGKVDGGYGSRYNECVTAEEGSTVNIYGGSFTCGGDPDGASKDPKESSTTLYGYYGDINIYNGYFENTGLTEPTKPSPSDAHAVFNIQNNSGAKILCYGGQFLNQNPADGDDKDTTTGKTFVADGYKVEETEVSDGIIYTVVKDE